MLIKEEVRSTPAGLLMLLLALLLLGGSLWVGIESANLEDVPRAIVAVSMAVAGVLMFAGLFVNAPNQGVVLTLFGAYRGTAREPGLRWANPFYGKRKLSLRVRNFETQRLKVNDLEGNPVEIAAVVVWKVVDTA